MTIEKQNGVKFEVDEKKLVETMLGYFKKNRTEFYEILEDMAPFNGFLGDDIVYDMNDFNDLYYDCNPLDIISYIDMDSFDRNDPYFVHGIYGIYTIEDKGEVYDKYLHKCYMHNLINAYENDYLSACYDDLIFMLIDEVEN